MDWARYWAHHQAGTTGLGYDAPRRLFAVPVKVPLPRLLARALCLCSGMPPLQIDLERVFGSREFTVFTDVPSEVAFKVADKLGSALVPKTFSAIEECD